MLLVRSEIWVQFPDPLMWPFLRVHEGFLTVKSDRVVIKDLVESLLRHRLKHFQIAPCDAFTQWLSAMHGAFTGKNFSEMNEQDFMERFGLESLVDGPRDSKDWSLPATMCAALAGQPHLVTRCLETRCSVDAGIVKPELSIGAPNGSTALHAVCYYRPLRQLETMEVLLSARADVERCHDWGLRPLHVCNTPEAVELLLRYRADISAGAQNRFGTSIMSSVVARPGNADTVDMLIRHGAQIGQGLLSACSCNDDTAVIMTLLAHRAEPYHAAKPKGAIKYYSRALAIYHGSQVQSASPLVYMLADTEGLTPLGAAASSGKANMVRALLDARAAPDQCNWRGLTAQMLAEREGFPHLFSDLAGERVLALAGERHWGQEHVSS